MKVVSVNVRGPNVRPFLHGLNNKISVSCVYKRLFAPGHLTSFNDDWEGLVYHSVSDSTHSRGVSILLGKRLEFKVLNNHKSDDARKVMVYIEIENQIICIISA